MKNEIKVPAHAEAEAQLPDDLVWADGGHVSDVVLTALADGEQRIVPALARTHVERCSTCHAHLGHAALLSLHVGDRLAVVKAHPVVERRPLPRLAIALGLAAAAIGLVPSLVDPEARAVGASLTQDAPFLIRAVRPLMRLLDQPAGFGLAVPYVAAALLLLMGFAIVRILPQKETSR